MIEDKLPRTLDEVREAIDGLDKGLIELLARRQKLVRQAGRLKPKKRCAGGFRARKGGSSDCLSPRLCRKGRFVARSGRSNLAQHD